MGKKRKSKRLQRPVFYGQKLQKDIHTVTVKDPGRNQAEIKSGISEGKTYYIRLRVFKTVGKSDYYSLWSSVVKTATGKKQASAGKHGLSSKTEKIVNAHMKDFDYGTFDKFMEKQGGAVKYVRSLGGVFSKWVY